MATTRYFERFRLLTGADELLSRAETVDEVLEVLRAQARAIAGCDGVTVVRRHGEQVTYVGEDAIAPLWTGQTFPIHQCVSGLAIITGHPVAIPDIVHDVRVPHSAYLSTFVKSMAIYPLGRPAVAALGLYWQEAGLIARDVESLVRLLAQGANAAFERIALAAERAPRVLTAAT